MIVAPSILTVTEEERNDYLRKLSQFGIKFLHLDIMDGKFVPNITLGVSLLQAIRKYPFIIDTHLMVEDVDAVVEQYAKNGSDYITFHFEVAQDIKSLIDKIHRLGKKCGLAVKPNTPISKLLPYLGIVDLVLVMSVEPGFGGQSYLEQTNQKLRTLVDLREKKQYHYLIEVDGGIKEHHLMMLKQLGIDMVVMGTGLVNASDPQKIISEAHK